VLPVCRVLRASVFAFVWECAPAAFGRKLVAYSNALRGVALRLCPQSMREMIASKTLAEAYLFLRPEPGKGQNILKLYVPSG